LSAPKILPCPFIELYIQKRTACADQIFRESHFRRIDLVKMNHKSFVEFRFRMHNFFMSCALTVINLEHHFSRSAIAAPPFSQDRLSLGSRNETESRSERPLGLSNEL